MTGKKLFATIFVLVALVVWGATTPNVTVAADQLRTRDRLQDPTACLRPPLRIRPGIGCIRPPRRS